MIFTSHSFLGYKDKDQRPWNALLSHLNEAFNSIILTIRLSYTSYYQVFLEEGKDIYVILIIWVYASCMDQWC